MAEFVLVAGAWLGSWAWDEVVPELRAAGHGTHPLTLSGLADKQGVPAGQQTHVQDIVDEVERHDLRDVILVGHSYSGIPVGQAAEWIGDRLARAWSPPRRTRRADRRPCPGRAPHARPEPLQAQDTRGGCP
jgi:hypothetical protein